MQNTLVEDLLDLKKTSIGSVTATYTKRQDPTGKEKIREVSPPQRKLLAIEVPDEHTNMAGKLCSKQEARFPARKEIA